jgi:hypothetical protein
MPSFINRQQLLHGLDLHDNSFLHLNVEAEAAVHGQISVGHCNGDLAPRAKRAAFKFTGEALLVDGFQQPWP